MAAPSVIPWDNFLGCLITVRNSTSVMESFLYFLCVFSLIPQTSWTENMTTTAPSGELEEKFLRSGDSHIENLTIQLSVEPLPQPSPLVGTFPHDFQLLPSTISRRTTSYHRTEGHNYAEQGENLFLKNRKHGKFSVFQDITIITRIWKESYQQLDQKYLDQNRLLFVSSELSEGGHYGGGGEVANQAAERAQVSLQSSVQNRKYFRERKIFQAAEQAQHGAAARAALMAVNQFKYPRP